MFFPFLYFGLLGLGMATQTSAWFAAFRRKDLPRWARWGHGLVFLLLIPATILAVGATDPKTASTMLPGAWLLGLVFVASAVLTVRTAAGQGASQRLCALGIALFDVVFGLVCLLRFLTWLGVDLPAWVQGLVVAHAATMGVAAIFLYIFFPVLELWPFARVAPATPHLFPRILNSLAFVFSILLLALLLGLLPHGVSIVRQWRQRASVVVEPRPGFRHGVVVRIRQDPFPDDAALALEHASIRELGAQAVNLFVPPTLMSGPVEAVEAVGRFTRALRDEGRTVIVTADYPSAAWIRNRPRTVEAVQAAMAPYHRFLLEHVTCDLFVPYIEPYGAFVALTGQRLETAQWIQLLTEATAEAHLLRPGVRTAVYVGQDELDEALYRELLKAPAAADVLGTSVYSLYAGVAEIDRRLDRVSGWLADGGGEREHWIFEFGQSPLTMGGEQAQAGYILHVLDWASREPAFRGACVFALADYAERMGLRAPSGRPRHAWNALRDVIRQTPSAKSAD